MRVRKIGPKFVLAIVGCTTIAVLLGGHSVFGQSCTDVQKFHVFEKSVDLISAWPIQIHHLGTTAAAGEIFMLQGVHRILMSRANTRTLGTREHQDPTKLSDDPRTAV